MTVAVDEQAHVGEHAVATYSAQLSEFLVGLRGAQLPDEVRDKAISCLLDSLGVTLVGATTPWAKSVQRAVAAQSTGGGSATVFGGNDTAPLALAALANGTSGHSLDYDDDNAQVHVGAAIVPVALAVGEHVGASGQDVLAAIVAGYEGSVRCGWAMRPENLHKRGFHPTGVCNPYGATAAAGVLLGLTVEQLTAAFGIVGSMAAGVSQFFEDGTMTKRLHAGQAAESGVNAALLAKEGFTGPTAIFEGRLGICHAFVDDGHPEAAAAALGERYLIMETAQKGYPINFAVHAPIGAILKVMREHGLSPDDVEHITAGVRPMVSTHVGHPTAHRPQTVLAAQMSLPYGVGVAMQRGTVTLDDMTESAIRDPEVLRHAAKVEVVAAEWLDRIDGVDEGSVLPVDLHVRTTAGVDYHETIHFQHGDPRDPLTADDLVAKFRDCTSRLLTDEATEAALDTVQALAGLDDVRELTALLRGPQNLR
jgi:2-methylcitrate dehydratase PrpD